MRLYLSQTVTATASTSGRPAAGPGLAAVPPAAPACSRRRTPGSSGGGVTGGGVAARPPQQQRGVPPCRVTNEGREVLDPATIKGSVLDEDEYIMVDPDNPIPNPQLGAMERRIGLPYEEALFADDVDAEAEEYWFTEPASGWNSGKKRLRKLEALEIAEEDTFQHRGVAAVGRIPLVDVREGVVMQGRVAAQLLFHGAQVDIGAEFDALLPCTGVDMWDEVGEALLVGQEVEVRVYRTRDPQLYRFPVQAVPTSSELAAKIVQPDAHEAPMDLRTLTMPPEKLGELAGRAWNPEDVYLQTEEEYEYDMGMDLYRKEPAVSKIPCQDQAVMDAVVERLADSL